MSASTPFETLEPVLAADEIQGNILGGFNKDHQALIPLRFGGDSASVAAARGWLLDFLPSVTWLREVVDFKRAHRDALKAGGGAGHPAALWSNVAFSFPGLKKLAADAEAFTDLEFRDGLSAAASARLGDPTHAGVPGHIGSWKVGGPGSVPDLLVLVAGDDPGAVASRAEAVASSAAAAGMSLAQEAIDIGHDLSFYNGGGRRRILRATSTSVTRTTSRSRVSGAG